MPNKNNFSTKFFGIHCWPKLSFAVLFSIIERNICYFHTYFNFQDIREGKKAEKNILLESSCK